MVGKALLEYDYHSRSLFVLEEIMFQWLFYKTSVKKCNTNILKLPRKELSF